MSSIYVLDIPQGPGPADMRGKFVGMELPVESDSTDENTEYRVLRSVAVAALEVAGEFRAAEYWKQFNEFVYLIFPIASCEFLND
jgi:hypothetical protein